MVHSVTPEDDSKLLEKEKRAKRFAYSKGSTYGKKDPWSNKPSNENYHSPHSRNNNSNEAFPQPSQFRGKTLKNYSELMQKTNHSNENIPNNKSSNLLNKAWNINKVPFSVSQASLSSQQQNTAVNPSFFSRHTGLASNNNASHMKNIANTKEKPSQHQVLQNSWNTRQSQFSYSKANDKNTFPNFVDDDDDEEFNHEIPIAKVSRMSFGNVRPVSARTKKTVNLHDAYLRSRGLGKYATPAQSQNNNANDVQFGDEIYPDVTEDAKY